MDAQLTTLEKLTEDFENCLRGLHQMESEDPSERATEARAYAVLCTRYYNTCYSTAQLMRSLDMFERSTAEEREMIASDIRKLRKQGATGGHGLALSSPEEIDEFLTKAKKVLVEVKAFLAMAR